MFLRPLGDPLAPQGVFSFARAEMRGIAKAELARLLQEARQAGRLGWEFERWWLGRVCGRLDRRHLVRHEVWLACQRAHAQGLVGR